MSEELELVAQLCDDLRLACRPGCSRTYLHTAVSGLKSLTDILEIIHSMEEGRGRPNSAVAEIMLGETRSAKGA